MPRRERGFSSEDFDVSYGLASASLTAGLNSVCTTGADYHGISIIATATTTAQVIIFDSNNATGGNVLDTFIVAPGGNEWIDRYIPVKAKIGITVGITGAGAKGAIFYGPKG